MITTINLSVLPATDEETFEVLDVLALVTKTLAVKGITVSVSVNTYADDDEDEESEEPKA